MNGTIILKKISLKITKTKICICISVSLKFIDNFVHSVILLCKPLNYYGLISSK